MKNLTGVSRVKAVGIKISDGETRLGCHENWGCREGRRLGGVRGL